MLPEIYTSKAYLYPHIPKHNIFSAQIAFSFFINLKHELLFIKLSVQFQFQSSISQVTK